jgi:NAD(P)-dependent dehydrogenase (short-subunit alcohol dehydrogenase family)
MDVRGKTAVITGASTGIGRAIAVALAEQGAHTALLGRRMDHLRETSDLVRRVGGSAMVYKVDLQDALATQQIAARILDENDRLAVIANVAGVWHDDTKAYQGPLLHETPVEETLEVLRVGIEAPMVLTAKLLPPMVEAREGHVVNVSGTFSDGGKGWLHYYVSKKALENFTIGLAQELRPFDMQVNCVSPADVATEAYARFYPDDAESALHPADVAEVVVNLLGDACRHVTGQIVEVRNRSAHV